MDVQELFGRASEKALRIHDAVTTRIWSALLVRILVIWPATVVLETVLNFVL